MARDRVTVQEAARRLGVKDDAIRKRIQRGTLEHDKGPDGRVYVYLEPSSVVSGDKRGGNEVHGAAQDAAYDTFLASLQDQVRYLRSNLNEERDARRRADTIIAQLTRANAALAQRVPELTVPQEPSGGPQSAGARSSREEAPPVGEGVQEGAEPRSWWRRVLGG